MYFAYVLYSKSKNRLYYGFTSDLKRRLEEHQRGLVQTTQKMLPVILIYLEGYINENDARRREKFFKSGRGREFIRGQLKNTLENF